jgi:integrase
MKIERLKSGLYRTVVYLGKDPTGRRIQKSITDTNKQRLARRAAEMVEKFRGRTSHVHRTFADELELYIYARQSVLSPSTIAGYRSIQKQLIQQTWLTDKPLIDITDADLRRLLAVYADKSPRTLHNLFHLISATYSHNGLRMPPIRLPAIKPTSARIPDAQAMAEIVRATKGTRLEIPVALAIMGLRRSEICGLSVTDLDRSDILHVHRGAVYDSDRKLTVKNSVKNASSDRYIRIPHELAQSIRRQGYITDMQPDTLTAAFKSFLRRNGFPAMRLHDCRHFMASYLHSLGIPDAEIMRIGGWRTDYVMKSVYRHALAEEETARRVAEAYEGILSS